MSYVYLAKFKGTEDLIKIGITTNHSRRFKQLEREYGCVQEGTLVIYTPSNYKQMEKLLHSTLEGDKVSSMLGMVVQNSLTKKVKRNA